jgi:hypothetical protein
MMNMPMPSFWKRRKQQVESPCVSRIAALVTDQKALTRLLQPLPESDGLRPRLLGQFFARAWHQETARDFWITSDGMNVECFTISGLTLQQAARVRVRWDLLRGQVELTEAALTEVVAKETRSGNTHEG